MSTELHLSIKSYFEKRSLDDLKSIWRKRYLCFLSNCLIREEEHDNGAKERIAFLIQQRCISRSSAVARPREGAVLLEKRPPEEESFWNGVRLDKELMIREDVFDKKSQIEALDVLCVSRSRKSNIKLYWNRLMARKKGYHNRTKAITRVISMDMKSTYNDLTFSDEGSSSFISLTNVFSEISSHKSETISPLTTNEIKTVIPVIEENEVPSSPEPEIVPINLTNTFLATSIKLDKKAESNTSLAGKNKKIKNQYISRDIAEEALKTYQVRVLANEKPSLDWRYQLECTKYIPHDFKQFVVNQLQDPKVKAINFTKGRSIDKFVVDCNEDVLLFLDKFNHVSNLESLSRCLDENLINYSTSSDDLIYAQSLFVHFFTLYKNDVLLQPMSEREFNAHLWTPLLRNAFLEKTDLKLSYGTELLAQEDGVLNTHGKKIGDLRKLEYCTKIILTVLFFALPSASKPILKISKSTDHIRVKVSFR
ncbi:hypothetical protein RhiirA4_549548 [Rhizophagus irregularis]|uniref:Uncharacterized protein n=1 Tax=Rhizophagus irregularis TaxID=588596 RepID=A0A2I1HE72_9GLOM|nr:hypothetical protein RhiirA4_549548 [Rhizophagus irregularis]